MHDVLQLLHLCPCKQIKTDKDECVNMFLKKQTQDIRLGTSESEWMFPRR